MQKTKMILLLLVLTVAACSPQRLQSSRLETYKHGLPFYRMTGYTDFEETAPKSSIHHIEYALSDACPGGVTIDSLQEYPAHNGAGNFLYWEAVAGCK